MSEVFYFLFVKKIMTHTIKLIPEIQVSIAVLNNERFLVFKNTSETRYVFLESYISVEKKDDQLILELTQSLKRMKIYFRYLSVK